jgi:hypothetical protein
MAGLDIMTTVLQTLRLERMLPLFQAIPFLSFVDRKFLLDVCRIQLDPRTNPEHRRRLNGNSLLYPILYEYRGELNSTSLNRLLDIIFQNESIATYSILSSAIRTFPCDPSRYKEIEEIFDSGLDKEITAARGSDRPAEINWEILFGFGSNTPFYSNMIAPNMSITTADGILLIRERIAKWLGLSRSLHKGYF